MGQCNVYEDEDDKMNGGGVVDISVYEGNIFQKEEKRKKEKTNSRFRLFVW